MPRLPVSLSETDVRPADAELFIVRADKADRRDWLAGSPVCPALAHHQIRHLAVAHLPSPYEIVRTKLPGSFFLACFGGEGRVLVDGRWVKCRQGQAALLPPGTLQAFHTTPGRTWKICWVRYQERSGQQPLAAAQTPVIARFEVEPLRFAILGLYHEASRGQLAGACERWVELIHSYVLQFAQPARMDPRLWELWEQVAATLGDPWTITEMARVIHLSEKQLQRLCQKELGRSPLQQLIWLRMKKASELLGTSVKIETVARQVGYPDPFVFSKTFKRVMGWPPSNWPGRSS